MIDINKVKKSELEEQLLSLFRVLYPKEYKSNIIFFKYTLGLYSGIYSCDITVPITIVDLIEKRLKEYMPTYELLIIYGKKLERLVEIKSTENTNIKLKLPYEEVLLLTAEDISCNKLHAYITKNFKKEHL